MIELNKRLGWSRIAFCLVLGYLAYCIWSAWGELGEALIRASPSVIVIAALLSLANYGLRFVRWQLYLRKLGYDVAPLPSALIYISGFAFTMTPGKVGEMMRGALLRERGVPLIVTGAAFVSERLSDLMAVVALVVFGLLALPFGGPFVVIALGAMAIFVAAISQERLLTGLRARAQASETKLAALMAHAADLLLTVRRCHSPALIAVAMALSLVAWLAEGYAFHLLLNAIGIEVLISVAISIYGLSLLVGALSFLPGGIGGAEAAMVLMLVSFGATHPLAIAATLIIRVLTLWLAVALGAIALQFARKD